MPQENVWYETLHANFGQYFTVENVLYHNKTEHQDLIIFENAEMGRIMALDGVVQTTERDEFIYHEMMAHVPLFAHGHAKKVLIIGGGDGGMLREVCRHNYLNNITMVEIDAGVVEFCRQYLPNHNAGAYDDPRFKLVIDDGVSFVNTTSDKFDVIISDCTDPEGPGESLFTSEFYEGCARCLNDGGIFVAQNGVCFLQQGEAITSHKKLTHCFADSGFYQAAIPTYYGGIMTFAWATQNPALRQISLKTLQQRFDNAAITCRYYTPAVHAGSFALPQYLLDSLSGNQ
ncbi:polyamine aminopropyltransferase [Xenorhabdus cabanillasii]|uniref:Polyamine aminopropyltransferase n=1 Tax=Xenorhabdus cabanillasii JM26 TaxID=1427517 RepID=W1ITB8_9GAMM|nr:polyamine aminopropyltransferase [Xenorhabdus cabanillasii]PHM77240.1 spermidine synthase [Xenorhabdus cabanillasii JM26]CDL80450.1 Spermidine synthase [Xenorhabdus cabanillasii JM26]